MSTRIRDHVRSGRIAAVVASAVAATASGAVAQEALFSWSNNSTQMYGREVASLGDVDQDGTTDVALYVLVPGGGAEVDIESGATGTLIRAVPISTKPAILHLAGVGDTDGDGVRDFLVADPSNGVASLYSSATDAHLYDVSSAAGFLGYGTAMFDLGDLDGDACDDFAVTDPEVLYPFGGTGACYVYSGKTGALLFDLHGTVTNENFGFAGVALDDVDGDGLRDFAIARVDHFLGTEIVACSGKDGSTLFSILRNLSQTSPIDTVADQDGDGLRDLLTVSSGLPWYPPRTVNVDSSATGTEIRHYDDPSLPEDAFLDEVVSAGDMDGDGVDEFVTWTNSSLTNDPGARLFAGATGALLYRFDQIAGQREYFGLKALGDVDHDGFDDLLVGSQIGTSGFAAIRRGNDLFLEAEPNAAAAGVAVAVTARTGTSGHLALIVADTINHTPAWFVLGLPPFDGAGTAQLSGVVPPGLSGITIGLRTYTLNGAGKLIGSGEEELAFQ